MTQRVYFEEDGPTWSWWGRPPVNTEPEAPADDVHTVRWGYNTADLDRLAHMAARSSFTRYGSHIDRYHTARDALVDTLLAAPDRPDPADLLYQTKRQVAAHAQREQYTAGYNPSTDAPIRGHVVYWQPTVPTPSPEHAIVERVALWQILTALTDDQRSTLTVVAETGDVAQAAAVLGLTRNGVLYRLRAIRARVAELWCEHETPRMPRAPRVSTAARSHHRGRARITTTQMEEIRDRRHTGERVEDIAPDYGYSAPVIRALLAGRVKAVGEMAS